MYRQHRLSAISNCMVTWLLCEKCSVFLIAKVNLQLLHRAYLIDVD